MDFKLQLQFPCRKIKTHFLLLIILLSTANILKGQSPAPVPASQSPTPVPADPCNRGPFCLDGSLAANPDNCTSYYNCGSGIWYLMPCAVDTLFDNISMTCTEPDKATCQSCPPFSGTTPPPVTIDPGTCDNLTRCEINKKYPDRSNCTTYFLCQTSTSYLHISCGVGFVFDIYVADCVQPTNEFTWDVCYYRCVTPPPPTTESTQNTASTASTTSSTSADSTAFIASTASSTSVILTTSHAAETTSIATDIISIAIEATSLATETTSDAADITSRVVEVTSHGTETTSDATDTTSIAIEATLHATETTSVATETTSVATEATSDNNTNDEEKLILLIVIIVVVVLIIIAIIIAAVCCIKKKSQSKMDSENDIQMSLCNRTYRYIVSGKRPSSSPSKKKEIKDKCVLLTAVQTTNSVTVENGNITPISDGVIGSPDYENIFLKFEDKRMTSTELWKQKSSEAEMKNGFARGLQPLNALSVEKEQRSIKTTKPMEKRQPKTTR